jgi:hypothetical protein
VNEPYRERSRGEPWKQAPTFSPTTYLGIFSPGDPVGAAWLPRFLEVAEAMDDELDQILACGGPA